MDVVRLVTKAQAGDVDAFTDLVRLYQAMALGYAYSNLGEDGFGESTIHRVCHPSRYLWR